jgi:hypothetical protein
MKRFLGSSCLAICALALVATANAQQFVNFADLPLVNSPQLMPNGYHELSWGNFFYVNPYGWSGAGPGYKFGSTGEDVAFIGGMFCRLDGNTCFGTLTDPLGFVLVSADVAGGYGPAAVTATAYKNGKYVGQANFFVGMLKQKYTFPASWGAVTEVDFAVTGQTGDLVIYDLSLYTLGG